MHHLSADLDAIARLNRAARREADVVNNFEPPGTTLHVERFVHSVGARTVEEARRRRYGRREVDPGRRSPGICSGEIHRRSHHARPPRQQELRRWARNQSVA